MPDASLPGPLPEPGAPEADPGLPDPHDRPVEHVMERVRAAATARTLTLRDLIEAGGESSFVPAMMIPALLVVSPLSGIPVFSSIMGLTIAIIAAQMVFGRSHLWLPEVLMRRQLRGTRIEPALRRLSRLGAWIDRHSHERLRWLTVPPLVAVPQILCILCGLCMPFLELVPFSSSILGAAVLFFAVGILALDGLYIIGGMAMMGLATLAPITMILLVSS